MDTNFLMVDSAVPVEDAVRLLAELSPNQLVVCDIAGLEDDDEETTVSYYVFESAGLFTGSSLHDSVGTALDILHATRADVLHTPGPDVDRRRFAADTVVLDGGFAAPVLAAVRASHELALRNREVDLMAGGTEPMEGDLAEVVSAEPGAAMEPSAGLSAMAVSVDYPKSVPLGDSLSLLIALTSAATGTDRIPFAAAQGDVIDVVVSPKDGFVVEGSADAQLTVADVDQPLPAQIKLRAMTEGLGRVMIYAFRDGAALGSLAIAPEVVPAGAAAGVRVTSATSLDTTPATAADLELWILVEHGADGRAQLKFRLSSPDPALELNLKEFGPVTIEGGPGPYFSALYEQIVELPATTARLREIAAERLQAIGSTLFAELFPADLQALLWGLREQITTVWVQSDEPWIPWELCRLQGVEDGRIVEGPFLCEAFEITRWIPGVRLTPQLSLSNLGVIKPPSDLPNAESEAVMLEALASTTRAVTRVPADYSSVRSAFGSATYDAIHFVGHGRFPDHANPALAEISLAGSQVLRPQDISGATANLGQRRPLIFLNACQSGLQAAGLTGVGGWATAMLKAGAGAFVGSHWDVSDDLALSFATKFYSRLLSGASVATSAREARLSIRDTGDPTWLAYTVFAAPGAGLARE